MERVDPNCEFKRNPELRTIRSSSGKGCDNPHNYRGTTIRDQPSKQETVATHGLRRHGVLRSNYYESGELGVKSSRTTSLDSICQCIDITRSKILGEDSIGNIIGKLQTLYSVSSLRVRTRSRKFTRIVVRD
jgi:hypothetical protein